MDIQVLQEDLSKALATASHFINTKVSLPILSNFLLVAEKTKLQIFATNLEMSISLSIGAKITKEGSVALPAKTFLEIITNLPQGQISLTSDKEHLKITSVGFSGNLGTNPTNDFPTVPSTIDSKTSFTLNSKDLLLTLSKILFSSSLDESRPILTGVLFIFEGTTLTLVSSDGFRLSRKSLELPKKLEAKKLVIPRGSLIEVMKIAKDTDHILFNLNQTDNQLLIKVGDTVLTSRLIDGDFPNFEKIIPQNPTTKVTVDKEDFLRAVKLSSVFARESANVIKLHVADNFLEILSDSSKAGKSSNKIEAQIDGGSVTISYNFKFIEEFLNLAEGNDIDIKLTDESSPAIFVDPKDKDLLHLIMPVRIQS